MIGIKSTMNIKVIVHTIILTFLTLILFERFLSCYHNLMDEPTAFEEGILDDKTTFPSFTLCPNKLEDSVSIESFEDVAKEMEISKSKYTSILPFFASFADER